MDETAADTQRSQHTEDETVDVEQRKSLHQCVVAGPLPGVREGIEPAATAFLLIRTPLGGPVVPEV